MPERAAHIGEILMKEYGKMKEKYPVIVMRIGAMIGMEFVKDKESKEPYPEFVNGMIQTALQKDYCLKMQALQATSFDSWLLCVSRMNSWKWDSRLGAAVV